MKKIWYRLLFFLIIKIYFRGITLSGNKEVLQENGVLYLALHKNGAVDGWVYLSVLPPVDVMIAAQLTRNPLLKLFFHGIEVVRDKDGGERRGNLAAMSACVNILAGGKNLLVFPEGTSTLGPKHLEFKEGAALIIRKYIAKTGKNLTVIPLGVYYDDPTRMGGKAEITIGPPIDISAKDTDIIHQNITLALENQGVNVDSPEEYKALRRFATAASLYGKTTYSAAIKTARANPALFKESENYNKTAADKNLWKYKDVRVQPRSIWGSLWTFIITAPFVLLAFIFNALPLAVGYICGRKFADDINVISLWRIIPGATVFMVWIPVVLICGKLYGLAALMISFLGFILYGACKKHFISLVNYLKAPGLKKEFNLAREHAIKEISQ